MPKPINDYSYLRAWCRMMGSMPYYTESQVEEARRDKAPEDAVYKSHPLSEDKGRWVTFRDVENTETRAVIEKLLGLDR